jgi:hypothetical protein
MNFFAYAYAYAIATSHVDKKVNNVQSQND